jgi:hypothetical protein
MVAVVHLVTIGWISGSILGAFYIVAPLALGTPMPAGRADWIAWAGFVGGAIGMVTHFWMGEYVGMVWSAALVIGAIGWVGARAARPLWAAAVSWPVKLHVALAFANVTVAASIGALVAIGRTAAIGGASRVSTAFAHAHVAAIGWALMMVVGLAYRLLPMILPARPATGARLAASAVLIEAGLAGVVIGLVGPRRWLPAGGVLVAAGLGCFVRNVRQILASRLPRPPALPARDWSTYQVHGAFFWLAVATALGLALTIVPAGPRQITIAWIYGVAGLIGGLSQIVVGMQGRLLPMYAYYHAMAARDGAPPGRSAHALVSAPYARAIFLAWTAGVPWLAWGLAGQHTDSIRAASVVLTAGVVTGGLYLRRLMRSALAPGT